MTYTTVADVAAELGIPVPTDPAIIAQWNRWITRTENQIRSRIPDLDQRIADGTLSKDVIVDIVAAAVARVARNPEGLRSVTKAVDDGSITKTVDSSRSAGDLGLTDDEWAQILPLPEAFTIRLGPRC